MEGPVLPPKNYHINQGFRFVDDFLYCEELRVCDLLSSKFSGQTVATPLYVYSKKQIEANIDKYQTAMMRETERNIQLSYSVKANMNPAVIKLMMDHGLFLTLVSGHELRLALQLGQDPEKIILNGSGKMDWEVDLACKRGVLVNVDSAFNLRQTVRICQQGGYVATVLLRVNPDINPDVHGYVSTGQEGSKFGIPGEELDDVLEMAIKSERIRVISLFEETKQMLDLEFDKYKDQRILELYENLLNKRITLATFLESIKSLPHGIELCRKLREQLPAEVVVPEPEDLVKSVCDILSPNTIAILEPGRSLVGNSAILLSRVLGTKSSGKRNYIVLDGSMTEVIRPCLYGAYHHIELAEPSRISSHVNSDNQLTVVSDIVGPVCESADFLGKDRQLVPPHTGCLMAVFDTGAYCSAMSSNYNMRVRPAELLVDGDKATIIRKCETFENMMFCYTDCSQNSENGS